MINDNNNNEYSEVQALLRAHKPTEEPSRAMLYRTLVQLHRRRSRWLLLAIPTLAVAVLVLMRQPGRNPAQNVTQTTPSESAAASIAEAAPYDTAQLLQEEEEIYRLDALFNDHE